MTQPLNGARVLVTRPAHQADNLCQLIAGHGGVPVRLPTLAIAPVDNALAIRQTLAHLNNYQWLIFISANAVTMHGYYSDGVKMTQFGSAQIAAIGKATAAALAAAGLPVDLVPSNGYNSEALLAMPQLQNLHGQRCLIIRGVGGREELATSLKQRGASVDYLNVYQRVMPETDNSEVSLLLAQNQLAAITITSGEALHNLATMLASQQAHLFEVPLVVVSERIKTIAADQGFKRIAVTEHPSDEAILKTVTMYVIGGE